MGVGRQGTTTTGVSSGVINSLRGSNQPSRGTVVASKPSRRKSCEHPSCHKQPAFSYNGSGVRFCAQHRLKGMVNVRNRRCEGPNCTKEPYFGERGGKARFCATHKPSEEMVDVRHRRCEYVSCHKQPNYGYEGQRACFCSTHKLPNMVDVKHRRCAEPGCRGYSSFAFPGSKEKFCAAHRREGMVPSGRGRGSAAAASSTASSTSAYSPSHPTSGQKSSPTLGPSGQEASKRTIVSWENGKGMAENKRSAHASGSGGDGGVSGNGSSPKTRMDNGSDESRGGMVNHERRDIAGNYDHHRRSSSAEDPGTFIKKVEEARGRRGSEHDMELVGDASDVRRRGCPTEFSSSSDAAPYLAHDRVSPQHGDGPDSGDIRTMAHVQRRRSGSFDNPINTHRLAGVYQRGPSWASWSGPVGRSGEFWPRPPLADEVKSISFSSQQREDAYRLRSESVERDGGGSCSGDETRGGYPVPRFAGGVAGGSAAVQTGSFEAGGPSGGGSGGGGDLDDNPAFKKAAVSRRIEGRENFGPVSAWTETALVSRRLPDMRHPAPSQDTSVVSLNHHQREDLPKLDTVLASVGGGCYLPSRFGPRQRRNVDSPAWPRPDVASESFACARIRSGGDLCAQNREEAGGNAFARKASTSRVFTLVGPQRRLVKYDEGVGRLGPTLETLEPSWRASRQTPLPYA